MTGTLLSPHPIGSLQMRVILLHVHGDKHYRLKMGAVPSLPASARVKIFKHTSKIRHGILPEGQWRMNGIILDWILKLTTPHH